eukprot:2391034-Rhodomonas_salina.1
MLGLLWEHCTKSYESIHDYASIDMCVSYQPLNEKSFFDHRIGTSLRASYAMPGTDTAYGATSGYGGAD